VARDVVRLFRVLLLLSLLLFLFLLSLLLSSSFSWMNLDKGGVRAQRVAKRRKRSDQAQRNKAMVFLST